MANNIIPNYDGLYGDLSIRNSSEYIFLELISTRSQTFDWVIHPHIHTHLFQIFIVENGQVTFQEATQSQTLTAPCIFFVPPTQLHGLTYTPDVEGHILTVSSSLVEEVFKASTSIFQTFERIQTITNFENDCAFSTIQELVKTIELDLFSDQSERTIMLRALLVQFFVILHRLSEQVETTKNDTLSMSYFRKFQKLIKVATSPKNIPDFAADLNITPVHLNRICKSISGKSAIDLVNQHIVNEAQKYLLHTSYSVSEIAYLLHFEYPNYFAKLFKKYTGMSPVEFKKMERN